MDDEFLADELEDEDICLCGHQHRVHRISWSGNEYCQGDNSLQCDCAGFYPEDLWDEEDE